MSFRQNQSQQLSIRDSFLGLTDREKKALENSWAKAFADDIFPNINEKPFRVLYSDKGSRPNTPVNVIIGALIIKELFGISDDEVVENLMLDFRYQYALHTTSFVEQPLSDKSLSRFRIRCYNYESIHHVDLYHDCIKDLSQSIAGMMKIDGRIRRMDSTLIEANIRSLSRIELLYTCIAKLVKYLDKNHVTFDRERFGHYLDPEDYNRVIYHHRSDDTDKRTLTLLEDADQLMELCNVGSDDVTEYQLFIRCMSEQTVKEDSNRRLRTKEDGDMDSNILQNPSDPDATFRKKAGKSHRGYVANIEESVGINGSIVTDYQFNKNNVSDASMLRDHVENLEPQPEKVLMTVDGAYASEENRKLAEDKNIELVPTNLKGKDPDPFLADFELTEDGTQVLKCPAGHAPKSGNYDKKMEQCNISFDRNQCTGCPYQNQCKPKIFKRVAKKTISRKSVLRARYVKYRGTEQFRLITRLRNGIETIPSILKNRYAVNRIPVHGLLRKRFFFGSKIGALNFRKLFRFRNGTGHYAQNPLLG